MALHPNKPAKCETTVFLLNESDDAPLVDPDDIPLNESDYSTS